MESELERVEKIVELLAASRTECVGEWSRQSTRRAFQWAEYCERLHGRFRSDPAGRAALESRLHDTQQRLRRTFPSLPRVTFSDLAACRQRLLVALLGNPSARGLDRPMLFAELDSRGLVTRKSAFELLCNYSGSSSSEVRAKMFLTAASLSDPDGVKQHLDRLLSDGPCDAIASVLLIAGDKPDVQRLILDVLEEREGFLRKLCLSLPAELCAALSLRCPAFRRLYWAALKAWALALDYDVVRQMWTSGSPVTFTDLADRLRELLNAGPQLEEETQAELQALKLRDGDWRVRGVSVWTDLISEIRL